MRKLIIIGIIWQITSGYYHTLDIYVPKAVNLPTGIEYRKDKGYGIRYQDIRPAANNIGIRHKRDKKGFVKYGNKYQKTVFDRGTNTD